MNEVSSSNGQKDLIVSISLMLPFEADDETLSQISRDLWLVMKSSNARVMLSPYARGNTRSEITCVFEISQSMKPIVEDTIEMTSLETTGNMSITFNSIEPLNDPAHGVHISF